MEVEEEAEAEKEDLKARKKVLIALHIFVFMFVCNIVCLSKDQPYSLFTSQHNILVRNYHSESTD